MSDVGCEGRWSTWLSRPFSYWGWRWHKKNIKKKLGVKSRSERDLEVILNHHLGFPSFTLCHFSFDFFSLSGGFSDFRGWIWQCDEVKVANTPQEKLPHPHPLFQKKTPTTSPYKYPSLGKNVYLYVLEGKYHEKLGRIYADDLSMKPFYIIYLCKRVTWYTSSVVFPPTLLTHETIGTRWRVVNFSFFFTHNIYCLNSITVSGKKRINPRASNIASARASRKENRNHRATYQSITWTVRTKI